MLQRGRALALSLLIGGGWGLDASASEETLVSTLNTPIGRVEFSQTQLDRGAVLQGEELIFDFPFEVSSEGSVKILAVHKDCGCLAQSLKAGELLEAGSRGVLRVKADTSAFKGSFVKTLTLLSNQEPSPTIVLKMKAQITPTLSWSPALVEISPSSKNGRAKPATVLIQTVSKQTLHIEKVDYNKDTFDVSYRPLGDAWELSITRKGPLPTKPWFESIEVSTNSEVKLLKIPVVGTAEGLRR